jgi:thiamine-phosphate pyrophosphorylase
VPARLARGSAIICLVTDRRRLAARLGVPADGPAAGDAIVSLAAAAADAGVDLVQLREPDLSGADLRTLAARLVAVVHPRGGRVVVNDRLDVALASGAAGVHLPEQSLPPERVGQVVPPGTVVGQSLHDQAAVAGARALSYVIFGTVFETPSKPAGHPLTGESGLAAAAAAATVPVLAIGGVTAANAGRVAAAGAAGVAAVEMFLPAGPQQESGWLHEIVARVREAFDSHGRVS